MKAVIYSRLAGVFFSGIALVHLYRLFAYFPVQIGSVEVPQAGSWAGLVIAGALGVFGLRARP